VNTLQLSCLLSALKVFELQIEVHSSSQEVSQMYDEGNESAVYH
jgi:hypothetical protein